MRFEINGQQWKLEPLAEMPDDYDDFILFNVAARVCACTFRTYTKIVNQGLSTEALAAFLERKH